MSKSSSENPGLRKLAAAVLLVFMCMLPAGASASSGSSITAFDIDITVGDNNVYHVVQKITMKFEPDSNLHGLYMNLDLEPHVYFIQDDEFYEEDYRVLVRKLKVEGAPYERQVEDGILWLRIGDPDVYVDGQTITYTISYDYDPGDDGFPGFDMFYYGIIGNGWDQTIDGVTFQIHMPKDFDASEMGFSVGYSGDEGYDTSLLQYTVDGTEISGRYTGQLEPYEGIWLRIPLPEGYFVGARETDPAAFVALWISLGIGAAAVLCFLIFRPRKKPVVGVEFEPPDGLSSADVGYIIDGITETRDVVSLIIMWAAQGYIRIIERAPDRKKKKDREKPQTPDKKKKPKSTGLVFIRRKDLPENAETYQKLMFDKLFKDGPRVSTVELSKHFSKTVSETAKRIDNKFSSGDNRVFSTGSKFLADVFCGLSAFPAALMCAVATYYGTYEVFAAGLVGAFVFIGGYLLAVFFSSIVYRWKSEKTEPRRGHVILWAVLCILFCAFSFLADFRCFGMQGLLILGTGLGTMMIAPFFRRYTERGLKWLEQILGLRRFIERAEKSRLELLADINPEYFYSILPYAYVLGVTDVWAKQFEQIAVAPPAWYYSQDMSDFSTAVFTANFMQEISRAQAEMASEGSSGGSGSFSGGSSGGGFSGGGFGGGGGGSW